MSATSRIPGFYKEDLAARRDKIGELASLSPASLEGLRTGRMLDPSEADRMSENVIGCQGLPLSVGLNFRINGKDTLVPMAVEEPSIVAASSNAARLVRISGGFRGVSDPPIMTAQVQLDEVPHPERAVETIEGASAELLAAGDRSIPRMVERGGGCKSLDIRVLDGAEGIVVVHIHVDVGAAMGANIVDTVAESLAPRIQALIGGNIGLRILTNLPLKRMVRVRAEVSADALGGDVAADGIAKASRFAELDVFRAVTHNKGVMNAIDAVAVALGQDWRSIEAAAHAFAGLGGTYQPIAKWKRTASGIAGEIELPLAVGTVGGSTRAHQGVRCAFEIVDTTDPGELAVVMAAAGLAANLAALKALAGEGIQKGHMRLHDKKRLESPPRAARFEKESS